MPKETPIIKPDVRVTIVPAPKDDEGRDDDGAAEAGNNGGVPGAAGGGDAMELWQFM